MNILDHRILIPTSQETVWEYISDIATNPTWQVDCTNLSFVSTRHSGAGVRWRYDTTGGRSYVVEATAWYDKLGYEYTFVDGAPFRESKGRIRLQEIAEGTIVQWTFSYEMGGLLGGVRNAIATKRQIEGAMIDSLRSLWSAIQKSGKNARPHEIKSLMRDAPDYEARSHYKPRHPSTKSDTPAEPLRGPVIIEPPISDEDTRPRIPVTPAKLDTSVNEPVFLTDLSDTPAEKAVEITPVPQEVMIIPPVESIPPAIPSVETTSEAPKQPAPTPEPTPPIAAVPVVGDLAPTEEDKAVPPDRAEIMREVLELSVPGILKEDSEENLSFTTTTTSSAQGRTLSTDDVAEMDTSEVSIFDIFGLPRPSQTQEMQAISLGVDPQTATLPMPVEPVGDAPLRIGLRLTLRRKRLKIRRPS